VFTKRGWGHLRSDIPPGAAFPDFKLSVQTGNYRTLSELKASDPMIVG
jgi:hypothetical protein